MKALDGNRWRLHWKLGKRIGFKMGDARLFGLSSIGRPYRRDA